VKLFDLIKNRIQPSLLSVEVQGDHGKDSQPPLREIQREVSRWLVLLLDDRAAPTRFHLQVECWRLSETKSFFGVRAITVPTYNPVSVELRVHLAGQRYHWKCHLLCDSKENAVDIIGRARPRATVFLESAISRRNAIVEATVERGPAKLRVKRNQKHVVKLRDDIRTLRFLGKRQILQDLCVLLDQRMSTGKTLDERLIRQSASQLIHDALSIGTLQMLLRMLVQRGLLEPLSPTTFAPTILFQEYLEAHAEVKHQALQHSLQEEKNNLEKMLILRENERRVLQARLIWLDEAIVEIKERTSDLAGLIDEGGFKIR
jgi:hypothetical protein